jgi:hypothetical protein
MIGIKDRFETVGKEDRFYDFCLWEYKPRKPVTGKFRPVNLLFHSFHITDMPEDAFNLVATIRECIGDSRTVWGIKNIENRIRWELYFYDYRRLERSRSITRLLDIIRPLIKCEVKANENLHYFMFSIDITKELILREKELDEIHMYIGNPGSTVSSGICYSLSGGLTRLENFYFFFDAKKEAEDILDKIICSSCVDFTLIDINEILLPALKNCKVIVIANKQYNDSIYYSGIDINQLILFLKSMDYPERLVSFIEENRLPLDHLMFDAGFDYRMEEKKLKIIKSGYYGIF